MAIFPYDGGVGGALIAGEQHVPGTTGALIYLDAGNDLGGALRRVEEAGGKVVMGDEADGHDRLDRRLPRQRGNRTALHSPPQSLIELT